MDRILGAFLKLAVCPPEQDSDLIPAGACQRDVWIRVGIECPGG
jgi:hypothetical protein